MIRRLYVDNFRSLVDFTWEPGEETLVLGYNGSGKTSALEIVQVLKEICSGAGRLDLSIVAEDRTIWKNTPLIEIEVDIAIDQALFEYKLAIGFELEKEWPNIVTETLLLNGRELFVRSGQRVQLGPSEEPPGPYFPVNTHQSVVAIVGAEFGGQAIVPFRSYLENILYLKPLPFAMQVQDSGPVNSPNAALSNLVPWFLHLAKTPAFVIEMLDNLKSVWPELIDVETPEVLPGVYDFALQVRSESPNEMLSSVPLRAMSDGEKMLVALYVVAAYQSTHPPTTIIIDEPDNYVSLLEIQPWLLKMLDTCPNEGQLILVSHNEEMIRTMGREKVAYFSRKDHLSPTEVRGIRREETEVAPLRDLLRRGWLDE